MWIKAQVILSDNKEIETKRGIKYPAGPKEGAPPSNTAPPKYTKMQTAPSAEGTVH